MKPIEVAERIIEAVEAANLDGYTNVELAAPAVRVYWRGEIPEIIVAIARDARRAGIVTEFCSARYSKQELDHAVDAIVTESDEAGVLLSTISHNKDGSGITIGAPGPLSELRDLDAVRNSPVPITLESRPLPRPL